MKTIFIICAGLLIAITDKGSKAEYKEPFVITAEDPIHETSLVESLISSSTLPHYVTVTPVTNVLNTVKNVETTSSIATTNNLEESSTTLSNSEPTIGGFSSHSVPSISKPQQADSVEFEKVSLTNDTSQKLGHIDRIENTTTMTSTSTDSLRKTTGLKEIVIPSTTSGTKVNSSENPTVTGGNPIANVNMLEVNSSVGSTTSEKAPRTTPRQSFEEQTTNVTERENTPKASPAPTVNPSSATFAYSPINLSTTPRTNTSTPLAAEPTITSSNATTISPSTKTTITPSTKPTITPSTKTTITPSTETTITPSTKPTITPSTKTTITPSTETTVTPSTKTTITPSTETTVTPSITTTTVTPSTNPSTTTINPTDVPPSDSHERHFDGLSFFGGVVLAGSLIALGLMVASYRRTKNYGRLLRPRDEVAC